MMSDKKSLGRKIAKSKSKSKKDAKTIEIDSDDDENPLLDKLPLESVVKVCISVEHVLTHRFLRRFVRRTMRGPGR